MKWLGTGLRDSGSTCGPSDTKVRREIAAVPRGSFRHFVIYVEISPQGPKATQL